jgi:TIR domain
MIFVSYSHADELWRKRFEMMSKPISRAVPLEFWSDKKVGAGLWDTQIKAAMRRAEAVVFLVSPAFLASDYIVNTEVPYFFDAFEKRNLKIFWAYLEPCDLSHQPGKHLMDFQAMTIEGTFEGKLTPMSAMTDWQWKMAMVNGCQMIDKDFVKPRERPLLDPSVLTKSPLPRVMRNVPLLKEPARRNVEVLVYSGKWWRQTLIAAGSRQVKILHVGDKKTEPGTQFKIVAITTDAPLTKQTYPNLPDYRTKSDEIIVKRQ